MFCNLCTIIFIVLYVWGEPKPPDSLASTLVLSFYRFELTELRRLSKPGLNLCNFNGDINDVADSKSQSSNSLIGGGLQPCSGGYKARRFHFHGVPLSGVGECA